MRDVALLQMRLRETLELASVPVYAWGPPKPLPSTRCMVLGAPEGVTWIGARKSKKSACRG
jgi:hypothetical protein